MNLLIFFNLFIISAAFSQSQEILNIDKNNLLIQLKWNQETEAKLRKSIAENGNTDELSRRLAIFLKEKQQNLDEGIFISLRENIEQKLVQANSQFLNCDSNTKDISLEEKIPYPGANFQGPFFGVHRDHQKSYQTCYANTAKNLLVGTSQGEDIASFLDLEHIVKI